MTISPWTLGQKKYWGFRSHQGGMWFPSVWLLYCGLMIYTHGSFFTLCWINHCRVGSFYALSALPWRILLFPLLCNSWSCFSFGYEINYICMKLYPCFISYTKLAQFSVDNNTVMVDFFSFFLIFSFLSFHRKTGKGGWHLCQPLRWEGFCVLGGLGWDKPQNSRPETHPVTSVGNNCSWNSGLLLHGCADVPYVYVKAVGETLTRRSLNPLPVWPKLNGAAVYWWISDTCYLHMRGKMTVILDMSENCSTH